MFTLTGVLRAMNGRFTLPAFSQRAALLYSCGAIGRHCWCAAALPLPAS
jgi:hypothetical protein